MVVFNVLLASAVAHINVVCLIYIHNTPIIYYRDRIMQYYYVCSEHYDCACAMPCVISGLQLLNGKSLPNEEADDQILSA